MAFSALLRIAADRENKANQVFDVGRESIGLGFTPEEEFPAFPFPHSLLGKSWSGGIHLEAPILRTSADLVNEAEHKARLESLAGLLSDDEIEGELREVLAAQGDRAIPSLTRVLADSTRAHAAARCLARQYLASEKVMLRQRTLGLINLWGQLWGHKAEALGPELVPLFLDPDDLVKNWAMRTLRDMSLSGAPAQDAASRILKILESARPLESWRVQHRYGLMILKTLSLEDPTVRSSRVEQLLTAHDICPKSDSADVIEAVSQLATANDQDEVLPFLLERVRDGSPWERIASVRALARRKEGTEEVFKAIKGCLGSIIPELRQEAVFALIDLGAARAKEER